MDCNDDCDECQMANQDDLHAQISDIAPPHVRLRMKVFSLTYYSYIISNYNGNNENNNINNNSNNNNSYLRTGILSILKDSCKRHISQFMIFIDIT